MKKIVLLTFVMLSNYAAEQVNNNLSLIETNRLTLRFTTTDDRQAFRHIVTSDDNVCKHLFGASVNREEMAEKFKTLKIRIGLYFNFLMRNKNIPLVGQSNRWIILDKEHDAEPIGFVGLTDTSIKHLLPSDNYKNFSIFLKTEAQSKGYVKEITQQLIPALMSHKDYQNVDGLCFLVSPDNKKVMRCLTHEDGSAKNGVSDQGKIQLSKGTAMVPEPVLAQLFTISREKVIQQFQNK